MCFRVVDFIMNAFGLVIVPVLTWLLLGSQTTSELIILAAMGFPYVWLAVWDLTHPGRAGRALLTVLAAVFYIEGIFANAYYWVSHRTPAAFNETLGRIDAAYLSISTATTTGMGDIHPLSGPARRNVMPPRPIN
jgi:hypothetical protein